MKLLLSMLMIWVGVLTTLSFADDMEDVKAAVEAHWTSINAGDMDAVAEQHTPDFNGFLMDNSLLWEYASREEQRTNFKALSAAGIKFNFQIRHLNVKVYGNTAVAEFYVVGSVTWPGDITVQGPLRVTEVWIKDGGNWKEAHHHDSPLTGAPTQ